ncbi:kelch motif family [Paramuricea clavata]|uniref:Kelch motif family n=1 Tax=Paramuricea clavata TaxID=317549 RepID=A0A7D9HV06_PARCT|nr:kelch motif family [Paramuricea clavata]
MATVCWENKVLLLGGMDEKELDDVISYDTESGETTRLPHMTQKRGGCCAVNTPTVDTSSDCSSDTSTDTLVALASLRSLNTVERHDIHSHAWQDMPPTREAREFCTAVVSPVNFELEQ